MGQKLHVLCGVIITVHVWVQDVPKVLEREGLREKGKMEVDEEEPVSYIWKVKGKKKDKRTVNLFNLLLRRMMERRRWGWKLRRL